MCLRDEQQLDLYKSVIEKIFSTLTLADMDDDVTKHEALMMIKDIIDKAKEGEKDD